MTDKARRCGTCGWLSVTVEPCDGCRAAMCHTCRQQHAKHGCDAPRWVGA